MNTLNIRKANSNDISAIKRLIDENISEDYFSAEYISDIINRDNQFIFVSVDDLDNPIAIIYCVIDTLESACEIACIPKDIESLQKYNKNQKVCLYKTTCTDEKYRESGILSQFMNEIDSVTRNIDFDFCIVVALIYSGDKIPVHNILVKSGFSQSERIYRPWNKIKSYCKYCNSEYCKCDGMLYIKET